MRAAVAAIAVLLALAEAPADAATSRKACRASCQPAIAACMTTGGSRTACRRHLVRRCRRRGIAACAVLDATTSTTVPFPYTTTTTLNGLGAEVTVQDVRTTFEIGSYVPLPAAQYVLVDVAIRNQAPYAFTPFGFQLQAGGLGYQQGYLVPAGNALPGCPSNVAILPGGSLSCTLFFEIAEGTPAGRLAFGPPYSYSPSASEVVTEEFAIPVAVRPTATLEVLGVGIAPGPEYCTARPGFVLLQVTFAYTSHDGASGLDLNPYQFVLEAGGAIYDPTGCGYGLSDYCDGAIGVPIDGSASCSLVFQVPASVTEAALHAVGTRYPATGELALD